MTRPAHKKRNLNSSVLRSRLKLKNLQSEGILRTHHPRAVALLEAAGIRPGSLRAHAAKLLTAGAAATSLLFSAPASLPTQAALPASALDSPISPLTHREHLEEQLKKLLPKSVQPLSDDQEKNISKLVHEVLGIHAYGTLEGNSLNTSYGFIGAEQHLPRFPGDTSDQHDAFPQSGITPGRGAWGYFAWNKSQMTPTLEKFEKYYVAVPTLYLPDWTTRLAYLREWYKYRKVVVISPDNGHAVVAVVADSGPAWWTGKHFGGSPEVMDYLRARDGKQKKPVIMFFVDDPEDQVPLGPLEYNLEQGPPLLSAH